MAVHLSVLWHNAPLVFLLAAAVFVGKLCVTIPLLLPSLPTMSALRVGLAMSHIGELALVLATRALCGAR